MVDKLNTKYINRVKVAIIKYRNNIFVYYNSNQDYGNIRFIIKVIIIVENNLSYIFIIFLIIYINMIYKISKLN